MVLSCDYRIKIMKIFDTNRCENKDKQIVINNFDSVGTDLWAIEELQETCYPRFNLLLIQKKSELYPIFRYISIRRQVSMIAISANFSRTIISLLYNNSDMIISNSSHFV